MRWPDGSPDTWEVRARFRAPLHRAAPRLTPVRASPHARCLTLFPSACPSAYPQPERNLADDVIADFQLGLEYCSAGAIVERRRGRAGSEFLVKWADGSAPSWEPEDHVAVELIMAFMDSQQQAKGGLAAGAEGGQQKRQLPKKLRGKGKAKAAAGAAPAPAAV